MKDVPELVEGYRNFRNGRYAEQTRLYRELAERGQHPRVMVIACIDSRADPATIFSAPPGGLLVVRNVANLVPHYAPDAAWHGTSAAIEFGVVGLEVETILVMGHGRCGGIQAFLDDSRTPRPGGDFIGRWMSLLDPIRDELAAAQIEATARHRAAEFAAVRYSLDNLLSFPFVRERVEAGRLKLRGAWFEIETGRLLALDPETDCFEPVL